MAYEHPQFPRAAWVKQVLAGATELGYMDWASEQKCPGDVCTKALASAWRCNCEWNDTCYCNKTAELCNTCKTSRWVYSGGWASPSGTG